MTDPLGGSLVDEEAARVLLSIGVPRQHANAATLRFPERRRNTRSVLDRDRNHFLKAFRGRHGFDRSAYSPELLAQYESGLAELNSRVEAERQAAAQELLAANAS